jgi:hypothetical protein
MGEGHRSHISQGPRNDGETLLAGSLPVGRYGALCRTSDILPKVLAKLLRGSHVEVEGKFVTCYNSSRAHVII